VMLTNSGTERQIQNAYPKQGLPLTGVILLAQALRNSFAKRDAAHAARQGSTMGVFAGSN
jgi:hypothetical protein